MISENHLLNVCLYGQGSKSCCKLRPIEKNKIDTHTENFIKDCNKRKINPKKLEQPLGNNCEGLLVLKDIKQGYDC